MNGGGQFTKVLQDQSPERRAGGQLSIFEAPPLKDGDCARAGQGSPMKKSAGIVRAGGRGEAPGFLFQNFLSMPSVLAAMIVQGLEWIAGGVDNQVQVSSHWLNDLLIQAF